MMGDLLRPETFEFFARYLLAGFVIISVRSRLTASRAPKPGEFLLDAVVLSLINQAVFYAALAVLALVFTNIPQGSLQGGAASSAMFYAEILLCPVLIGTILGRFAGAGPVGYILRRLSMPGTHPIAQAYDFAFAMGKAKGFVILTYADGTRIYGYFGDKSLAATDEERSDIFLEALYTLEQEQWVLAEPPRSAWISLDGIRSVEFLGTGEAHNGT